MVLNLSSTKSLPFCVSVSDRHIIPLQRNLLYICFDFDPHLVRVVLISSRHLGPKIFFVLDRKIGLENWWHILHHLLEDVLAPIPDGHMNEHLAQLRTRTGVVIDEVKHFEIQLGYFSSLKAATERFYNLVL